MNNLKQMELAVANYATDNGNNNKLPELVGATAWGWDIPWNPGKYNAGLCGGFKKAIL